MQESQGKFIQEGQGKFNKIYKNFALLVRGYDIFMHKNLIKILNIILTHVADRLGVLIYRWKVRY